MRYWLTVKAAMAKKKKKIEENPEVVTNCDHLENGELTLSQHDIEKLIIIVRGKQVLIDQDIARLYGVTTKRLNQQANRNSARFPSNFRFELKCTTEPFCTY